MNQVKDLSIGDLFFVPDKKVRREYSLCAFNDDGTATVKLLTVDGRDFYGEQLVTLYTDSIALRIPKCTTQ